MAITIDDFNKIWASTSPLTPYSFSESNYKEGWNFIGSTPPARQMWDYLQKNNDEKAQFLADAMFKGNPLTFTADDGNGNTVSLVGDPNGSITWNGKEVERVNASGTNYIRYESGLQICWDAEVADTTGNKTINFPQRFSSVPRMSITSFNVTSSASNTISVQIKSTSITSFGVGISVAGGWSAATFHYVAIGYWK